MPTRVQIQYETRSLLGLAAIAAFLLFLTACPTRQQEDQPQAGKSRTPSNTQKNQDSHGRIGALDLFELSKTENMSLQQFRVSDSYGKLPLRFEPNRGQFDSRVNFAARSKGYDLFVTSSETVLVLKESPPNDDPGEKSSKSRRKAKPTQLATSVRMRFVDGNKKSTTSGVDEMSGTSNYITGNQPSGWRTNIPNFARVKQDEVYPGVDVLYYGNENQLEFDLTVEPGVDPKKIKLKFEGTEKTYLDSEGNLRLPTSRGELRQSKPIAYQLIDGRKVYVECNYTLPGGNNVGFEVGEYDRRFQLTIDPVVAYSTNIGGTGSDYIKDVAVDAAGNLYVTGYTYSTNFPTTSGSYRTSSVGASDVFVLKLNSTGTALIYSTYIGGSSNQTGDGIEYGNSIAVDGSGNAYVSGRTSSSNFPVPNARQPTYGGSGDAFLLKLNAAGSSLLFSTYHGGSADDFSNGVAVDSGGNAYITGGTISQNFPVLNAYQSELKFYLWFDWNTYPSRDIFVSKFDTIGSLVYSTYLGGEISYLEQRYRMVNSEHGNGIAVDSQGNAYVTGVTNSKSFPMINAVDGPADDRRTDAFVVKFNAAGNALLFSTYLAGEDPYFWCCIEEHFSDDAGIDIAVDAAGSAYVVGNTQSSNFPIVNAFQSVNKSSWTSTRIQEGYPHNSVFVTKFNPTGNALEYSTYLGGSGLWGTWEVRCAENASGISVDSTGSAYVTGNTCSNDFPVSNSFLQSRKNAGDDWDAFVTKFTPAGTALQYSSYVGGSGFDLGNAIAVDTQGNAYLAGTSGSTNFPTTAGAYQPINRGSYDGFVMKVGNANGVNIAGQIRKPDGTGVGGLQVRLTGALAVTTTTDGSGNYLFPNLPLNQDYTVTPVANPYTFQPANQVFNNLSTNVTADFTVIVYSVGGRVTEAGVGVPGITITLIGGTFRTAQTDAEGYYLFTDVLPGNYTVFPSKSGPIVYVFTPPNYTLNGLSSDQTANFTVERMIPVEVVPIADAYVQDGSSANANFGGATSLKVETDSKTNNGKNFDSYLKFDLGSVNRNIRTAKLRIYAAASSTGSLTTSAYSASAVNWVESGAGGITWNNRPARSASALTGATATVTGTTYATYDIDVTTYVRNEKNAGRNLLTLVLHNPSSSTQFITANSREAPTNRPRLVVTTSADENLPPVVTMTSPADGTVYTAPTSITVSASVTDPDGSISRVDFFNGTNLIGSSSAPVSGSTYSINWTNVSAGSYILNAIAYDNQGAPTTSTPVQVQVTSANTPPTVAITSPINGSSFSAGKTVSLTASVDDLDGSVTKVDFYSGAALIGTANNPIAPGVFTLSWANVPAGAHTMTARATDNSSGESISAPVVIYAIGQIGLSPIADAYVQDGATASTNFGTAAELRSQLSTVTGSNRETFLKFDISAASGITKAKLRLFGRLNDSLTVNLPVEVSPVASTTWVESGNGSIVWNNKPAIGSGVLAAAMITDNTDRWYEFDLTAFVQAEKTAGRNTISIAVKGGANSSSFAEFNSKEAASNQPQLMMLTTQPRDALLVVGSATLNSGDNAVKTRLQNLGFTVTAKVAGSNANSSIKNTDANGKALVLVSSTVTAGNVGTKLRNIPVPVLNWEFDLADDFGMTNAVSGQDFGTAVSQSNLAIVDPGHPMASGLSGTVSAVNVPSTFSWGKPNANAIRIVSLSTDATRFVNYGYDRGSSMFGLESPARRAAVFLSDTTAANLSADGGALFDAVVRWATDPGLSPTIVSLEPMSGPVDTPVTVTGMNFGELPANGGVTFNGVQATIDVWTDTSITASVPQNALTGPVVVIVDGITSNGVIFSVTTPNGDSDGDGLADSWEMTYFGNLGYGAGDDPDGDGLTNLQEYLQGRNPTRGAITDSSVDLRVFTRLDP